jgi:hypothetical protein
MDTKKARSSAPEILPSLSRSKCWKIRCSSPCLLLELELDPDLDPLPNDDDDDKRVTAAPLGLATSDCPHMNGSLKLRLLDGRFAISVLSLLNSCKNQEAIVLYCTLSVCHFAFALQSAGIQEQSAGGAFYSRAAQLLVAAIRRSRRPWHASLRGV